MYCKHGKDDDFTVRTLTTYVIIMNYQLQKWAIDLPVYL